MQLGPVLAHGIPVASVTVCCIVLHPTGNMSSISQWLRQVRLYPSFKMPLKKKIQSYSIWRTIGSPNKILLTATSRLAQTVEVKVV